MQVRQELLGNLGAGSMKVSSCTIHYAGPRSLLLDVCRELLAKSSAIFRTALAAMSY